jgi:nucleoside-diphosphate-sugar epimerase
VNEPADPHGRRVFVTGANGFVGRALVAGLAERGALVGGVDVVADPERGVVAGDITEPATWSHHLDGYDVVIHTAAIMTNNVAPTEAWHVNVIGSQRVLDTSKEAGVARFVYLSTMGVARFAQVESDAVERYHPGRPLDEHFPVMPVGNPYTDTKIAAEHLTLAAHAAGEMTGTVIRPADVFGAGSRPWILEPLKAIDSGRFVLPAHGRGLFTPIYIDDLVSGVIAASIHEATAGHIIQLGGETPVTTSEYFGYLYRMLGRSDTPRATSTRVAVAVAEAARLAYAATGQHTELGRGVMQMLAKTRPVSNTKAHELLGWWPQVDLPEGMRRTEVALRAAGLLPRDTR